MEFVWAVPQKLDAILGGKNGYNFTIGDPTMKGVRRTHSANIQDKSRVRIAQRGIARCWTSLRVQSSPKSNHEVKKHFEKHMAEIFSSSNGKGENVLWSRACMRRSPIEGRTRLSKKRVWYCLSMIAVHVSSKAYSTEHCRNASSLAYRVRVVITKAVAVDTETLALMNAMDRKYTELTFETCSIHRYGHLGYHKTVTRLFPVNRVHECQRLRIDSNSFV